MTIENEGDRENNYAGREDWELRDLLYDRDQSIDAYTKMVHDLDAKLVEARAERDQTRAELEALLNAASLTASEQDLALDGDAESVLDSISERIGAGIERAERFLRGEKAEVTGG